MSLMAAYVDGKLETSSTSSESLKKSSNKSSVDSDTFLTLLVAEMQNQDPLEPTSNTEWVSQYATFTQVEQLTEMGESMDLLRANSMIGKEVIVKVTSESTGETSYKRGTVDYVTVEEGKALLVIDEQKYSIEDLDSVASEEYFTAYDKFSEFVGMIDALPNLNLVDKSYENTIGKIYDLYNNLTDYQKNYVDKYASGYVESYKAYIKKMEQLGITYGTSVEDQKVTSLEDVLDAFNKKMDELMTQITTLNSGIQSGSSGNNFSGNESAGLTEVANNASSGASEQSQVSDVKENNKDISEENQESGGTENNKDVSEGNQASSEIENNSDVADASQTGAEMENNGDIAQAAQASNEAENSDAVQNDDSGDDTDDVVAQLTQDTEQA